MVLKSISSQNSPLRAKKYACTSLLGRMAPSTSRSLHREVAAGSSQSLHETLSMETRSTSSHHHTITSAHKVK